MRILFVTHLYHPARGGAEGYVRRLAEALAARGHAVRVVTSDAYSTEAFFLRDRRRIPAGREPIAGVEIERLPSFRFGRRSLNLLNRVLSRLRLPWGGRLRSLAWGPRNPSFLRRIDAAAAEVIVACPLPTYNVYYAWRAAQRLHRPLVVIPCYHRCDPGSFANPLFFRILRSAAAVIALTAGERDFLAAHGGVALERLAVLPPLPLSRGDLAEPGPEGEKGAARRRLGLADGRWILFIGQHGVHKKIDCLLKAMPAVWRECPTARLLIAGGTTTATPELKTLAAGLSGGESGRILFHDDFAADQKGDLYAAADVFVSLSEHESFGIVLVEAMARGVPVVASRNGVAASLVDDHATGLLVDPRRPADVAAAIVALLTDEAFRAGYGARAREKAVSVYHPDAIVIQWEELLAGLVRH